MYRFVENVYMDSGKKTALRYMLYFTFVHNGVSIRKIIITT